MEGCAACARPYNRGKLQTVGFQTCPTDLGIARRDPLVWSLVFIIWMGTVCTYAVDTTRYNEGEDLLASPKRLWSKDSWLWQATVPGG